MTASRTRQGWRTLLVPPASGAANMARDEGLMQRARVTGETVFAVYGWERATLSLGRNQTARGMYDERAIDREGVDVVRRPTGGRALLHHREVTYSVTAPVQAHESLIDSYHRFNRILLSALYGLGVDVMEAEVTERTPPPTILPCFAAPTRGELVSRGSKLVGSAQVRENGALLQHGSILIEDDQATIARLLVEPTSAPPAAPAATLASGLGRIPSLDEVAAALFGAVHELEDADAEAVDPCEADFYGAQHLERYRSEWWTWRR